MSQDVVHPPEQLQFDEISSPISAQIFDFCDPELFPETLPNSEVTSCSNGCYDENNSYTTNLSFAQDMKFNGNNESGNTNTNTTTTTTTTTATTSTTTNNNNNNLSVIMYSQEELENDISASIDFSPSPPFSVPSFVNTHQDQFDFSSLQSQIPLTDVNVDGLSQYPHHDPVVPLMGPPLPLVFEEDCLSSVPSCLRLNPASPSCSFLDPTMGQYLPGNLNTALSTDSSGMFSAGSILMGSEVLQHQDLEFQGDNGGIYCPDSMQRVFHSGDLQLVNGGGSSTPLATEISSLEESTFKVGKLSVEQRKEKIHRYMKKRNERNFSKKIKYACRKTLADSRPRVRGRFAKNDDFGETPRLTSSNHEDDDDEDGAVKEEDDMVDSSDIFSHISGVNSFKCNYPIQSWI